VGNEDIWRVTPNIGLMYPAYIVWYQSTMQESVLKHNALDRMMQ
jgi:hypothetical protein